MKKNLPRSAFLFFILAVFFLVGDRNCSAAAASSTVSVGLEIKAASFPAPEVKIQELDGYQARIYGRSVSDGKIHLRIEGPGGYEKDAVIKTSYLGNWEYTAEKFNAGSYQARAFVVDANQQQSQTSAWKDFHIVMEPPQFKTTIVIEGESQKAKISGSAFPGGKVRLSISTANEEVIEIEMRVNNNGKWSYMTSTLNPGAYDVSAYAFDGLDNRSERSKVQNFDIAVKPGNSAVNGNVTGAIEIQPSPESGGGLSPEGTPIRSLIAKNPDFALNFGVLAIALAMLGWLSIALKRYFFVWNETGSPHLMISIREGADKFKISGAHFEKGEVELDILSEDNKSVGKVSAHVNKHGKFIYKLPNLKPGAYSLNAYALSGQADSKKHGELLATVKKIVIKPKPDIGRHL